MQAADYLRRIPLFADLTPDEMADVLRIVRIVELAPGEPLCTRGAPADCLYIVEHGEAVVRVPDAQGKAREVARVVAGELLGELGLVDGQARSADVVAATALRAYRVDRAQFDKLRAQLHPAAFKMLRRIAIAVSGRVRAINSAISDELGAAAGARPRASRAHTSAPQPAAPAPAPAREPEERSLLRSVLARLSGGK